jgi:hypothetical protein
MPAITRYRFELRHPDGQSETVGGTDAPFGTGTALQDRARQLHEIGKTGQVVLVDRVTGEDKGCMVIDDPPRPC